MPLGDGHRRPPATRNACGDGASNVTALPLDVVPVGGHRAMAASGTRGNRSCFGKLGYEVHRLEPDAPRSRIPQKPGASEVNFTVNDSREPAKPRRKNAGLCGQTAVGSHTLANVFVETSYGRLRSTCLWPGAGHGQTDSRLGGAVSFCAAVSHARIDSVIGAPGAEGRKALVAAGRRIVDICHQT